MNLKQQIQNLKIQGMSQYKIAKQLNCSTGSVSYHCNPEVKKKSINYNRINRKKQHVELHPYLNKEIDININPVNWKTAELLCAAKLTELNYEVFSPMVNGGEIDLIAYKDNISYRVQIKSVTPKKSHCDINLLRETRNTKTTKTKPYTNIDFYLIYDGNNIYKLDFKPDLTTIVLRYKIPTNNQITNIHMAKDYIFK